jgi:hypothetical protein
MQPPKPQPAALFPETRPASVESEEPAPGGAWVAALLFLIVLAAGVALALFTLVPYELLRELIQGS